MTSGWNRARADQRIEFDSNAVGAKVSAARRTARNGELVPCVDRAASDQVAAAVSDSGAPGVRGLVLLPRHLAKARAGGCGRARRVSWRDRFAPRGVFGASCRDSDDSRVLW